MTWPPPAIVAVPAGLVILATSLAFLVRHLRKARRELELSEERSRFEETLKKVAAEWQTTFDAFNDAIALLDRGGAIIRCNGSMRDMLGLDFKEIMGRVCCQDIHQGPPPDDCPFKRMLAGGRRETGILARNDRWYKIAVDPLKDPSGAVAGAVHVISDITEQRRIELSLRESEERYRDIFENASDLIQSVDSKGRFMYVNKAWKATLGYDDADLTSMTIFDVIHPSNLEHCRAVFSRVMEGESVANVEAVFKSKDGRLIMVEGAAGAKMVDGACVSTRGIFRDVSERHRLEAQLRQSQKMEAVGRLAGGVAHDFNNLLTTIIGTAETMERRTDIDASLRGKARLILETAERAAQLTRRLLTFSRKQVIQPVVLNLNDILRSMNPMLTRLLGEDISLILTLDPELPNIMADAGQMEQVVMNLAVNAREAMPAGGEITLDTGSVFFKSNDKGKPVALDPGHYVLLVISDTGAGIASDTMEHILEPFFTTKKEGTGLGLSTVFGIVTQAGGNILCESVIGKGTSFWIYLPAVSDEVALKPPSSASETPSRSGTGTILLVEDDYSIRSLIAESLRELGYTVQEASSAEAALAWIDVARKEMRLLITDVILPGIRGTELAREIRRRHADTAVLFISGYSQDRVDLEKSLDPRSGFLPKPFTLAGLARKIDGLLEETDLRRK